MGNNNDIPAFISLPSCNGQHRQTRVETEEDKMKVYLIESMCRTITVHVTRWENKTPNTQTTDRLINLSKTIMEIIDEDDYYKSMSPEKMDEIILEYLLPIYKIPSIVNSEKHKLDVILFHFWWRKLMFNRITDNTVWKRSVVLKPSGLIKPTAVNKSDSRLQQYQRYHQIDDMYLQKKSKKDVNVISCLSSLSPMRVY